MSSFHSDRNLVAGLLALQLDYVSKSELVEALLDWNKDKEARIEDVLKARGHIDAETCRLLGSLTDRRMSAPSSTKVAPVGRDEWATLQASLANAQAPDLTNSLQTLMSQGDLDSGALDDSESRSEERTDGNTLLHPQTELDSAGGQVHTGAASHVGRRDAPYEIQALHAQGGLGEVFLAQDRELNRQVALKQIRLENADNQSARSRFLLEAEVTGRLEHPGVVPVYGLGTYPDGRHFYAMRFIRGSSLKESIQQFHARFPRPYAGAIHLELRKLLDRFIDVCQTIEYAHSRGVLHRDIKPDNVMLGPYGETLVVDWGLAKAAGRDELHATGENAGEVTLRPDSASTSAPTLMGSVIGTPAFMSPEQARGQLNRIGPKSDVFSLGATLYYLLTGKIAALGDEGNSKSDIESILSRVSRGEVPPPRKFQSGIPRALEAICLKAMKPEPDERYPSAKELGEDVERFLADEPVTAYREPWLTKSKRWVRRHQALAMSLASIVLLAALGLGVFSSILSAKQEELARANTSLTLAEKQAREAAEQAELRRQDAVEARAQAEEALTKTEQANKDLMQFSVFLQDHILATAKPKGLGGLGREVTVIEALIEAEKGVSEIFADSPSAEVTVRNGLADTWKSLGNFDRAEANAERAVELVATLQVKGDEDIHIEGNYASILRAQGKFDESIALGQRVVQRFLDYYGPTHPNTLTAKNNIAKTYIEAGEYDTASKLLETALSEVAEQDLEEDPSSFELQSNYAEVLRVGDAESRSKALAMLKRLYELHMQHDGEAHPKTCYAANNLATFLSEEGDYDTAISMLERVSEVLKLELGDDHPDRLVVLTNLGDIVAKSGDIEKSLQILGSTCELAKRKLTTHHPTTLNAMDIYANHLAANGDFENAIPMLGEVVSGRQEVLGPASVDTLTSMNNLGFILAQSGSMDDAIEVQQNVVKIGEENFGESHSRSLQWKTQLARLMAAAGRFDAALNVQQQVADACLQAHGESSEVTWDAHVELAPLYIAVERFDEAKEILGRVQQWLSDSGEPDNSPRSTQLTLTLALLLRDQGEHASAAEQYQKLIAWWQETAGDEPSDEQRMQLRSYLAELATLELELEAFEEAKSHASRSLDIANDLIPDDWRTANAKSILGAALSKLGELEAAEPLLVEGQQGVMPVLDFRPEIVQRAFDRLIHFYKVTENESELAKVTAAKAELFRSEE